MGRYYTRSKAREERERSFQGDSIHDDTENSFSEVTGNDSFYVNSQSSIVTENNQEDESNSILKISQKEPTRQRFKLIQNKKEMSSNASITDGAKSKTVQNKKEMSSNASITDGAKSKTVQNKISSKSQETEETETPEMISPSYKTEATKIAQNKRNSKPQKTKGTETSEMVISPSETETFKTKKRIKSFHPSISERTEKPETVTSPVKNEGRNIISARGLYKLIIFIFVGFIILSVIKITIHDNKQSIKDCHDFEDFIEGFRKQNNLTSDSRQIKIVKLFFRHFMDIKRPDPAVLMIIYDDLCGYDRSLNFSRGLADILSKDRRIFDMAYLEEFSAVGQTRLRGKINDEVGQVNVFASLSSYPSTVLELFFAFCDHENYLFENSAFIITVNVPEENDMGSNDIPESLWDLHEDSRLALNSRVAKNVIDFRPLACQ